MGDIFELPKRRSPKQLARAYMMGELADVEYPKQGGLRNAMLLADGAESEIARMQALAFIEKLADLQHEVESIGTIQVKLIDFKNDGFDNAVQVDTA